MSAFQLGSEHLGAMVRFYLKDTPDHLRGSWRSMRPNLNDAEAMLATLAGECYASVRYRYPTGPLPGPIAADASPVVCHDHLGRYRKLTPVEAIKACHCYNYQSCEHPAWDKSEARRLTKAIESAAIAQLDGYNDAPWEITGLAVAS